LKFATGKFQGGFSQVRCPIAIVPHQSGKRTVDFYFDGLIYSPVFTRFSPKLSYISVHIKYPWNRKILPTFILNWPPLLLIKPAGIFF
jgi:hypothetical protein